MYTLKTQLLESLIVISKITLFDGNEQLDHLIPFIYVSVIDFSLLQSGSLQERSKVVKDLGKACKHWRFCTVLHRLLASFLLFYLKYNLIISRSINLQEKPRMLMWNLIRSSGGSNIFILGGQKIGLLISLKK